jgi:ribose/xylose/arabinose/galactoside ABC-type transport system permease subunit
VKAISTPGSIHWFSQTLVREIGALAFLVVLCLSLGLSQPAFFTAGNLRDILVQVSSIAITAAGMTFVIVSAGIDLSVGSVLALSGCAGCLAALAVGDPEAGIPFLSGHPVLVGTVATLGTGALCGLVNGYLITGLRLPPFIATLGVMSIARGLAFWVSDNSPVEVMSGLRFAAKAKVAEIPLPILLILATFLMCGVLLKFTLLGRYTYAIGGNEEAARLSGVRVGRTKLLVYMLCGMLAGLSGLIVAGRLGWMQPQEGDAFELDVIAAVVIGGTSLYGGQGSLFGTLLGALIMGVVRNGLNLLGVNYNVQKIVLGTIIVVAVSSDVLVRKFMKR